MYIISAHGHLVGVNKFVNLLVSQLELVVILTTSVASCRRSSIVLRAQ